MSNKEQKAINDYMENEAKKGTKDYNPDLDPANVTERMTSFFMPVAASDHHRKPRKKKK